MAYKTELKNVKNKIPDVNAFVKKNDYVTEITSIKNDYATKAILDSQLSELKTIHIADEAKKVNDKVSKNSSDISGYESRLKQKGDTLNDAQKEISYFRGKRNYDRDGLQNFLLYKGLFSSFQTSINSNNITK